MRKFIIAIKGILPNGKLQYCVEDEGQFYFVNKKEQAQIYIAVEAYEAKIRLEKFLLAQIVDLSMIEIKRIEIK